MCQLLGLSANKRVDIDFSLKEFRHRGKENPHGWGFAFHEKGEWTVLKKETSLWETDIAEKKKIKSKTVIGHVRLASCRTQNHENTHPFKVERWVFAHNGTVSAIIDSPKFPLGKSKPEGATDSEYAFCYLLAKIASTPRGSLTALLEEEAGRIKECGKFNFLLSDGTTLYAYGDDRFEKLYYVQRKSPFGPVTLKKDDKYEIHLKEIKASDEVAVIVATEPLTGGEEWVRIEGLRGFKDGFEVSL